MEGALPAVVQLTPVLVAREVMGGAVECVGTVGDAVREWRQHGAAPVQVGVDGRGVVGVTMEDVAQSRGAVGIGCAAGQDELLDSAARRSNDLQSQRNDARAETNDRKC